MLENLEMSTARIYTKHEEQRTKLRLLPHEPLARIPVGVWIYVSYFLFSYVERFHVMD
jgi:hypothetical protein